MGNLTVAVYQLAPPATMRAEEFQQFLRSEVFPAVITGQTRAGIVTGQRLFKASDDSAQYIWIVEYTRMGGWESPSSKAEPAVAKLKAKGAHPTGFGDFDEIDTGLPNE